jgi:metalloendopeptidase OMA1, mitochondrial
MLKLPARSFLSRGPSTASRLRPPPSRPTTNHVLVAARSISLSRLSPVQRPAQPNTPSNPTPRFPLSPRRQQHTPLTLTHSQHRAYNYHPDRNRTRHNHNPQKLTTPYEYDDPSLREARLRAARPLVPWRGWRALNTPSTYTVVFVAIGGALVFYFANLETVPVSGRTRFNVYGVEKVRKAGEMEFKRLMW